MAHYCDGSEFLVGESGVPCTGGIVSARDLAMWGRWLMAIDKHDTVSLSTTREYHDFLRSVQRLELAHQSLQSWRTRDNEMCIDQGEEEKSQVQPRSLILSQILSFLQHEASDDIIARVFDYLESFSLAKVSSTCVRFRRMGHVNARKRTSEISLDRQLGNVMQLLRAQEQIDGIYQFHQNTGVNTRIPLLLLRRRVHVTNAGDPEYNGIYYCTGCNGNGYLFSKPRFPVQRVQRRRRRSTATSFSSAATSDSLPETPFHESSAGVDDDTALPGQPLRCIISKRFSNETILWYLSKEVAATVDQNEDVRVGDIIQVFSFWAKLMVIGDASPDICRYPSQTSILSRNGRNEGWQTLSTTRTVDPPVVELLD